MEGSSHSVSAFWGHILKILSQRVKNNYSIKSHVTCTYFVLDQLLIMLAMTKEVLQWTHCGHIFEELPRISQASSGQYGSAGSQGAGHNVWVLESHVDGQHSTVTEGHQQIEKTRSNQEPNHCYSCKLVKETLSKLNMLMKASQNIRHSIWHTVLQFYIHGNVVLTHLVRS